MNIGKKIRQMRNQKGLTQEELADRCELTKGYISQLENDLTSPSIATLSDIIGALGTSLKEFFNEEEERPLVYKKADYVTKEQDKMLFTWLIPSAQKNEMEPALVTLAPGGETEEDIPHEGEEFGFVLEGKIAVTYGKKTRVVAKGESFYYSADKRHKICNKTDKPAKILWISSPPNF